MKLLKYELFQSAAGDGKDITITKEIPWSEANYANALTEAYSGEITVEDIPDPVTEPALDERNRADIDYLAVMMGVEL